MSGPRQAAVAERLRGVAALRVTAASEAAPEIGAGAFVIDLAGAAAGERGRARKATIDGLPAASRAMVRGVRVRAQDGPDLDADLDAAMRAAPDFVMLFGAANGADVQRVGAKLAVREAENGWRDGATAILPEVSSAAALLELSSYRGCSRRLAGLTWNAEALACELGVSNPLAGPLRVARGLILIAAASAGAPAFDSLESGLAPDVLKASATAARADGFRGKLVASASDAQVIADVFARPR